MEEQIHLRIKDIALLFFITMGPMRTLLPFTLATKGTDRPFRRKLALNTSAITAAVVVGVAVAGPLIMHKWGVSTAAVALTGAMILFYQAFQQIVRKQLPDVSPKGKVDTSSSALRTKAFSLAVPGIISPAGIAFIVAIKVFFPGEWSKGIPIVIGLLLVIVLLNLVFMLNAARILRFLRVRILLVVAWIFSLFQAFLALQIIIRYMQLMGLLKKGVF